MIEEETEIILMSILKNINRFRKGTGRIGAQILKKFSNLLRINLMIMIILIKIIFPITNLLCNNLIQISWVNLKLMRVLNNKIQF